ncbi:MAG: hypothetical protein II341_09850, partial [Oscillospiraceae bacterium]|nr:hypothetical protein [Oscillospiraceae bacterium]
QPAKFWRAKYTHRRHRIKPSNCEAEVYHAENPEQHFIWTAWASGTQVIDETGAILFVDVTLPEDAKAGDHYTVEYADWSLADKGHVWSNDSDEWAASGDVTWTDGGVTVTE